MNSLLVNAHSGAFSCSRDRYCLWELVETKTELKRVIIEFLDIFPVNIICNNI